MDFSWVRQLAEESNQHELDKQENERQKQENERLMALATVPFVEKLFMLFQACSEEFNKHYMFPELRVAMSRLSKKAKGTFPEDDEIAYFTMTRQTTMVGVRGINGTVEFIREFPVTAGAASLSMRLDELGVDGKYILSAKIELDALDNKKKQVLWVLNDEVMDGPKLITLCQQYFSDFIKASND